MDFASIASGLVPVITGAITAAVPVIAVVLGGSIAYRVFKRFVRG